MMSVDYDVVKKADPKSIPLPREIIPFILENVDGFDIMLEEGERVVITARPGAQVNAASKLRLQSLIQSTERTPRAMAPLRPKFIYSVKRREYGPEQAKAFGMSKPRLRVYEIVYAAGDAGVGYKRVRDESGHESGLQHGSVMQILHWLRKQDLIVGTPDA